MSMSNAVEHSGWAYKQGSKIKNWKKRFFELRGRELTYYASQNGAGRGEDEKGRVVVVAVEEALPEDGKGAMLLITCERKSTLLKIKPMAAEEAVLWRKKIEEAISGKSAPSLNTAPRNTMAMRHVVAEDPRSSTYASRETQRDQATKSSPSSSYDQPSRLLAASSLAFDDHDFDDNQEQHHVFAEERVATNHTEKPPGSRVTREGWVSVGTPQDKMSWKTRYAVLAGATLSYYVAKGAGQPIETVRLVGLTLSREKPNALELRLANGRMLGIAVDSREDLMEWERSVASVLGVPVLLRAASSRDEGDLAQEDSNAGGRPSSYTGVFCEGWLMQKRSFGRTDWERRYFVLNGAQLQERDSPGSQTTDEGYVVHMTVKNDASIPEFEIELMSGRTLLLHAENTVDAERWIHALSDLVVTPGVQAKPVEAKQQSPHSPPAHRPVQGNTLRKEDIHKTGWLLKEGSMIKSWKRRYFVLNGDTLQYFEKASGGYVLGSGIIFRVVRNTSSANALDIHFLNGRILRISAKEKRELDDWFDMLCAAAELSTRPEHHHATASSSAPNNPSVANMQHGWLLKRGQMLKNWKRRYFTLQRNRLTYYGEVGGELLGAGVVFDVAVGDQRPLCIDIRFQNGRLLHVVAADDQDFKQWHDALKMASDISESFLSQKSMSQDDAGLDNEFEFDVIDEDGGDDMDSALGDMDDDQQSLNDEKDGYDMWEAAMNNKPEFDRSDSWDSEASGSNNGDKLEYDSDSQSAQLNRRGSDVSSIPDEPRGCSGYLRKEGGNVKTWKRRFFTLHGVTLKYFKSASGSLLRSCEVVGVEELPSVKFGFAFNLAGGRRLVVSAESSDEYEAWLLSIWGALADNRASLAIETTAQLPGVISIRSVPSSPVASGPNPARMNHSGWLEKEGQRFKTWKKRYFTLKNGTLMYFNDVGGVAQGHGGVIAVELDRKKPHTLRILLGKDRIMRVTAPSQADMTSWYNALASSCKPSPRGSDLGDGDFSEVDSTSSSVVDDRRSLTRSPPTSPAAAPQQSPTRSRFNSGDYLANDTITNESFIRIRGTDDELSLTNGSFHVPRQFKGELTFTPTLETPGEEPQLGRLESDDDIEYLRGSTTAADLALLEKIRKQKEEDGVLLMPKGCAPCCQIM